jgi:hypothetical protein
MPNFIPPVVTRDDLPRAIEAAASDESIRWYVIKKADSLRALDMLPDWDLSGIAEGITAASRFFSAGTRRNYAKQGVALSDGSFPIPDRDALRRAIIRLNTTTKDKGRVRRHIVKRARALNALGMLPDTWAVTASGQDPLEQMSIEALRVQMDALRV